MTTAWRRKGLLAAGLVAAAVATVWAHSQRGVVDIGLQPVAPTAASLNMLARPLLLSEAVAEAHTVLLLSNEQQQSAQGRLRSARFRVARVIVGSNPGRATVTMPDIRPNQQLLADAAHALLFLKDDGSPVNPGNPILPLGQHIQGITSGETPLETVERYLVASLAPDTPPSVLEACVAQVCELRLTGAAAALTEVSRSEDPVVSGWGLVGLVGLGDARAFPAATQYLLGTREDTRRIRGWMGGKLGSCVNDPALAPHVVPLLASRSRDVRAWAALALFRMRAVSAGPALITALSDEDRRVRHLAVMALASTFPEEYDRQHLPAPAVQIFQADPDRYTQPWRDWWEREGKAKYGKGAGK